MKKFSALFAVFAICAAAAVVFTTGCETQSADELCVSISPSYAKLGVGQSVTLTASGGWNYRWKLSNYSIGNLSANTGSKVVYTARAAGTQTVTVTGMGGEPATVNTTSSSNNKNSTTNSTAKASNDASTTTTTISTTSYSATATIVVDAKK